MKFNIKKTTSMIYKNNYIVIVLSLFLGFSSCDVERLPETVISDPSFWRSENDLKSAANYFYTFLPRLTNRDDEMSDDAVGSSPNSISDGTRLIPATDNNYNTPYRLIRAANNLIEKAPRVLEADVAIEVVDSYIAEARFFRAWAYFSLFQKYGGVPLILETLTEDSELLTAPAASREDVIAAIYADLDFAIQKLEGPDALVGDNYGRITNTAAMAFKARVALFEGTRSKYHNYGNPTEHLTLAKNTAKEIMVLELHELFNSYYNLFQYEGEGRQNRENIMVRKYGKSISESISSHHVQRDLESKVCPTKALADTYLMTDGLPIDKSSLYAEPEEAIEVFKNRDPRMSDMFYKKGDPYIATIPEYTVPPLSFQRSGFANRSYSHIEDWNNSKSYIDFIIIRYAEVLLTYAEATYELNGSISDADLNLTINKLRARVGMPNLTNSFVATNGLDMKEEIRRERRIEFALQGYRYWDLIRWKTAEIELPKATLGNVFFDEFNIGVVPEVNSDNVIIVQKAELRSFDPQKHYLWPFPTNERALNPNLEQNPNW